MHNWGNLQKVKLSQEELEDLCERRKNGCELANAWLYNHAFALMLHQARRLGAMDEVDGFKERIDHALDDYDPQWPLTGFICRRVRSFVQHKRMSIQREREAVAEYHEQLKCNVSESKAEKYSEKCTLYPKLHKSISELPPKLQYILYEWYWNGSTLGEIGRVLGCTLQNVFFLRNSAVKMLQKKMAAELN